MIQRTPIKAIRAYCVDCSGGSFNEVTLCPVEKCPLYRFRLGTNPNIKKRELTDDEREKLRQHMRAIKGQALEPGRTGLLTITKEA